MTYKIYMGWDSREQLAYDVACSSILRRTKSAIDIIPLKLQDLSKWLGPRPVERKEDGKLWCPISQAPMATEFAISRFVVPFLQTSGWALFVDCDIICLTDITRIFNLANPKYAVMVVKHIHETGPDIKMGGQVQTYYSRKNWSSVVIWNCSHPSHQNLTLEALCKWPGRDLHAFKWLKDEEIGELPSSCNRLIGVDVKYPSYYPQNIGNDDYFTNEGFSADIVHMTNGGPWISGWVDQARVGSWEIREPNLKSKWIDVDDFWLEERKHLNG